jgi:uncharacterized protein YciI
MFVLEVNYTAPLERIDAIIPDHVRWLDANYAEGRFLLSGRQEPRTGGVIIAVGDDRAAIEDIIAADPFVQNGVGEYRVTQFHATKTSDGLAAYRQPIPGA